MRAWRKFLWPLLPSPKGCHFLPPWPVACLCRIVSLCMDPSLGLYNFVCSAWKGVAKCNVLQDPYLILVTTATTSGGVLFSSRCTFLRREGEILSYFGYLVTNLRIFGALFTNLNSVAVYQNWQISGMSGSLQNNCHNSQCYSTTIHQNTFTLTSEKIKNVLNFYQKILLSDQIHLVEEKQVLYLFDMLRKFPPRLKYPRILPQEGNLSQLNGKIIILLTIVCLAIFLLEISCSQLSSLSSSCWQISNLLLLTCPGSAERQFCSCLPLSNWFKR